MNIITDTELETLKSDIKTQQILISQFIHKSKTMFHLMMVFSLISVFLFLINFDIFGYITLFTSFIFLREYNKAKGMAEIHTALKLFFQFILKREQTGDQSFPTFLD